MTMYWGNGGGWMFGGWIFMILFWVLVIVALIAIVRSITFGGHSVHRDLPPPHKTPLQILQERYARGEIEKEEYDQKRKDLE